MLAVLAISSARPQCRYLPGGEGRCGTDWSWNRLAQPDTWHSLELYVGMNTPGMLPLPEDAVHVFASMYYAYGRHCLCGGAMSAWCECFERYALFKKSAWR
jgi:hypothetical protein